MNKYNLILSHTSYRNVAIPCMVANLSTPLLSAANMTIIGNLNNPVYLASISVGALMFDTIYWLFGFLRVLTTGYSAQTASHENHTIRTNAFLRPFYIAVIISALILLLQSPIWQAYIHMIHTDDAVTYYARFYFRILVWGAPAVLLNFVATGWLIGQQKLRETITIQILGNIVNIVLSLLLVNSYRMNIPGVAIATLAAQYIHFLFALYYVIKYLGISYKDLFNKDIFEPKLLKNILHANSHLMVRTICILIAKNLFTASSASFGTVMLAANAVITEITGLIVYVFEGLANASSIFAGKAVGDKDECLLKATWRRTTQWAIGVSTVIIIFLGITDDYLPYLFTQNILVAEAVKNYHIWLFIIPLCSAGISVFYGIFSGTTVTKPICNTTVISLFVYLLLWEISIPLWGNNGLWLSQAIFTLSRSVLLLLFLRQTLQPIQKALIGR